MQIQTILIIDDEKAYWQGVHYHGCNPDDIPNLVLFLVSDEASWITGSNFTIDGGALANT
jgi:NAD(P)-dependent dehydrogenase (short-subunit alcohol dehydrogenase family)